jgi:hypothetical protein
MHWRWKFLYFIAELMSDYTTDNNYHPSHGLAPSISVAQFVLFLCMSNDGQQ